MGSPQHIAIVMDGNGRWAKARNLPRTSGHIAGVETVKTTIQACIKQHIPILSLFSFSSENWNRPQTEVASLMDLFLKALQQEIDALSANQVQIRFIGDLSRFSQSLQDLMQKAREQTQHHQKLILNIAINYGGKWDIVQAARALIESVQKEERVVQSIDEKTFERYLTLDDLPHPDLFIRTGGEQRISNFFLWQLAYTELYFSPVYWPDFDEAQLLLAIKDFKQRQRRFGKTSCSDSVS